jgi:Ca-activated chloride channel family protein
VGGDGTAVDTDQVPDASKISPPVLREGERSGHDISLLVDIDTGVPLGEVVVPTHEVHIERASPTRAIVRLADRDSIPNRDFVLRCPVAGEAPSVGLLCHRGEEQGGFFTLMLVPQLHPADADVTPREVTFILDTSGSMSGIPMGMSKEVVRRTLNSLRPQDRFNIIRFAGDTGMLSPRPLENTEENVAKGLGYLGAMRGSGGTEMLKGVHAYLQTERDAAYVRIVCFLTDGYVGNEDAILGLIRDEGQDARWFAFGIGSSVNRYLIRGIGKQGNGASQFVLPREGDYAERAVETFFRRIDSPVLVDIGVDFGDLPVEDVYPEKPKDLFAGQPIVLNGRYTAPAEGTITVLGRVGAREVALPVEVSLPREEERNAALAPVWARRRIADLSEQLLSKPGDEEIVKQITNLALEFRLVSAYTAFVAVDESRIVGDGKPLKVLVPVEIPESVSREGAVGKEPVGVAVRVAAWGVVLMEYADSSVRVVKVDPTGAAEGKVKVGERVVSVGRTQIRGLRHLEALLLQASGAQVEIGFRPGDDPKAAALPIQLPRP